MRIRRTPIHPPEILLFDLGGVLIDFAGFEEILPLLPSQPDRKTLKKRWIESDSLRQFERGTLEPQEFGHRFVAEWQLSLSAANFLERFSRWVIGPYPGALDLLQGLKGRFRLACLSNSNELHVVQHRMALGEHLEKFYFSNEIRHTKPDDAAFQHVIEDLGTTPEKIAFFDDTPSNVEAAGSMGMAAYLTDGVTELRQCLKEVI